MELTLTIFIIFIGSILVVTGIIGCILPILPGPPLAYIALLLLEFGDIHDFNNLWLILLGIMSILILVADYLVPIYGAKRFGGSKRGVRGSSIGVILGIIATSWTGPLAIILGPFLGATVGERLEGKSWSEAANIGMGTLFGFILGVAGKLIATFIITITFIYGVVAYFL